MYYYCVYYDFYETDVIRSLNVRSRIWMAQHHHKKQAIFVSVFFLFLLDQLLNCHLNFLNMEKATFEMSREGKLLISGFLEDKENCKKIFLCTSWIFLSGKPKINLLNMVLIKTGRAKRSQFYN